MADIAGVFAASHTPVMLNFADAIPAGDREAVFAAFHDLGRRIAACRPDVLVVISDDHLHNFFLDNFPAVCIGAAAEYPTPVEHWVKAEKRTLPGHAGFATHLLHAALESFDPSFSMELTLDHGILTPLELAGVARELPLVPLLINCVQPPMPAMTRCLQWGKLLHAAIASYAGVKRSRARNRRPESRYRNATNGNPQRRFRSRVRPVTRRARRRCARHVCR